MEKSELFVKLVDMIKNVSDVKEYDEHHNLIGFGTTAENGTELMFNLNNSTIELKAVHSGTEEIKEVITPNSEILEVLPAILTLFDISIEG